MLYKQTYKKKNENVDYDAITAQKNEFLQRFQHAKKKEASPLPHQYHHAV